MKSLKRVLATVSAITMLLNPSTTGCFNAIAVGETPEAPITDTTEPTSDSGEQTEPVTEPKEEVTDPSTEATTTTISETTTSVTTTEATTTESTTTETTTTIPKDLSAPTLNVAIPEEYHLDQQWAKNTNGWSIVSNGDNIFYETREDQPFEDAQAMPDNLKPWEDFDRLEQGAHYIRFWASFDDPEREVAHFDTSYQLDTEKPSEFKLNMEYAWPENKFRLKNNTPIKDLSGIGEIYYTIKDKNSSSEQRYDLTPTKTDDGEYNIEFFIDPFQAGFEIIVYVTDNAGNTLKVSNNTDDYDNKTPEITSIDIVNAYYDENDTEHKNPKFIVQSAHEFGIEKLDNLTNYIYASDESYLKVCVDDDYKQLKMNVTINNHTFIFNADDLKNEDESLSKDGEYYISLKQKDFELTASKVYTASVKVNDAIHDGNTEKIEKIYYDPSSSIDSKISCTYTGNYKSRTGESYTNSSLNNKYDMYFGKTTSTSGNTISVSISDDVGIGEYQIIVNGAIQKQEKLYAGVKKEYKEEFDVTDEDGNVTTETKITEYQSKVTIAPTDVSNNKYTLKLEKDGEYNIEVIAIDLAGNRKVEKKCVYVDTSAPVVSNLKYELKEPGVLHYVTFGIYGHQSVSIKIKVSDKGTSIPVDNVNLYWCGSEDDTELKAYKSHMEGEYYVFEKLTPYGKAVPYIEIVDGMGNKAKYYFGTVTDGESWSISSLTSEASDENICLILENNVPQIKVIPTGNTNPSLAKEIYFGEVKSSSNTLNIDVTDDEGLYKYTVEVKDANNQTVYAEKTYNLLDGATKAVLNNNDTSIAVANRFTPIVLDSMASGKYTLIVKAWDLAGNESEEVYDFYIDVTAPEIEDVQYEVRDSILRYFTFGIFGKTTITISVKSQDDPTGCGINKIYLDWAGSDYKGTWDGSKYVFSDLPVNSEGVPHIFVEDKMGNSNTYYFTTVDNGSKDSNIGGLILSEKTSDVTLALENGAPDVDVFIPTDFTQYPIEGTDEIWYPGDVTYHVTAIDSNSGLNFVSVKQNDNYEIKLTAYGSTNFMNERFKAQAEYTYDIKEEGHYKVVVNADDNAGNSSVEKILNFHIDNSNPQITMFQFGDKTDSGSDVVKTTYGFYFMHETEARVYINDPGVTSGYKTVTLFRTYIDGRNDNSTVTNPSIENELLKTDENGTYVSFTIPMGFKGSIAAEVIDKVEHTSGVINADGNIVEDEDIHKNVSSLDIQEDITTDKQDANSIPLYNRNIPLTITAKDTFSGISTIEWSIANDGESGIITVANDGTYHSDSSAVTIGEVETESNLVISMTFAVTVDSNTNGNVVNVKLTDRSGNSSETSKTYSIDTTAPTITASFGNNNVQNGSYYKDAQTVNIAITERNFNGSDVQVKLNGAVQSVTWDDAGATVGQDSTVHNASFTISADGDYTYEITYTDRAGNDATPVTSAQFTIDLTDPKADISFNIGDDNLKDAYYNEDRTVTFNINEHNYSTATIHITKDGQDVSGNYDLSNWNPKDHSGDNHNQSVTLSENGYYVVSINVTDKSGRTVSEQSNGFYIDKDAPIVNVKVSNVANGAPSNAAEITPVVSVEDIEGNLDSETITLSVTAIKLDANNEIVPDIKKFIGLDEWNKAEIGSVVVDDERNPNAITFTFNNLGDDGIYTFEVTASDKAGNTGGASQEDKNNGAKYKISVNRLGSTYEVDEKIAEVDPSLRYFRNKEDTLFSFTITEYNVNQLKSNDSIVKMTCDGNVVENNVVATEDTGSDKWSKYTYEFPSELMDNSGKYIVKLYSVDEAGNENPLAVDGQDERATVTFFIDNDDPTVAFRDADDKTEFSNNSNYRTDSKRIEVEVYDNSQQEVKNVTFKLDGEDITADVQHEAGTMVYTLSLPSKSSAQNLSVSLEDIAGNHIETGVEGFLITTNLFVLWFSNTPLFIASIVVFLLAIAGIVLLVIKKKNKRRRGF